MSLTIDQAFITQFESEVHLAYQQRGSKLRGTVRRKQATGSTVRFQKLGKGTASRKTRHGKVPVMNAVHSYADATIEDWYAGDWVDKLDEYKTNIDERMILANTAAYALGRKIDAIIIDALLLSLPTAQIVASGPYAGTMGLTKGKIMAAMELINAADVPDDGQRFCVVGAHQWNELLDITEFKSADYVGQGSLPWTTGTEVKRWLNTYWILHTGLQTDVTEATRYCVLYHKTALGLGENIDALWTDITWHGDYASHFVDAAIASGAIRIDDEGVVRIDCDDDATIT